MRWRRAYPACVTRLTPFFFRTFLFFHTFLELFFAASVIVFISHHRRAQKSSDDRANGSVLSAIAAGGEDGRAEVAIVALVADEELASV